MTRRARPGFSLVEMIVVLAIVATIVGAASLTIPGLLRDRRLHQPAAELKEAIHRTAWESHRGRQPWQLLFASDGLYRRPAETSPEAEPEKLMDFDGLDEVSVAEPGSGRWQLTGSELRTVVVDAQHFAPAFSVRLRSEHGWIEQDFDPLTGEMLEERSSTARSVRD